MLTFITHALLCLTFVVSPACPTEDSSDCSWSAPRPEGHSFVDVGGTAYYLDGTPPMRRD